MMFFSSFLFRAMFSCLTSLQVIPVFLSLLISLPSLFQVIPNKEPYFFSGMPALRSLLIFLVFFSSLSVSYYLFFVVRMWWAVCGGCACGVQACASMFLVFYSVRKNCSRKGTVRRKGWSGLPSLREENETCGVQDR